MPIVTSIHLDGPFFQKDPGQTLSANLRVMLEAVAAEGAADVQEQLHAGAASRAAISLLGDHVAEHVRGRVASLVGRDWWQHAVISVNNSGWSQHEGISLMAAASRVESEVHAFRKTASRLRSSRAVNIAELTKGIE